MTAGRPMDVIETAAWFVLGQPGWIERTLARCVPRPDGDCAGCGTHRPVRWPCVQVWIAHTAQRLIRDHAPRSNDHTAASPDRLAVVALPEDSKQPTRSTATTRKATSEEATSENTSG